MKRWLRILLLVFAFPLYSTPIVIDDPSDYYILDQFFRLMVKEEAFGFVLEDVKPLSAVNVFSHRLIFPHSRFFQWDILAIEAIDAWNRVTLTPQQRNYVFKTVQTSKHKHGRSYHELLFINRLKLKEVIDDNIDLFRFHLGPALESSSLVECIADSPRSLDSIIKSNDVLFGILLGYGTYNSLMGARAEEIEDAKGSCKDLPPFHGENLHQLNARVKENVLLRNYFLRSIESCSQALVEKTFTQPGFGFNSFKEELDQISSQREKVPIALLKEKPAFIFAPYRQGENQKLFENLRDSQKRIQELLSRSDLLEYILEKITGEKPIINCSISSENIHLPVKERAEEAVAEVIWDLAQSLDDETVPVFIEAFCDCIRNKIERPKERILSGVLSGLKRAQTNLRIAEEQALNWSKMEDLEEVVPQGLYYKCIKLGEGKSIATSTDLLLSYVIEDGLGNVLSAQHRCWIDLSQTVSGFAHGIKGMRVGETREIYIHPAYGYGALTTLSPCVSLVVKVTLHQVNEQEKECLPSLTPIDLAWVKDSDFFEGIKEASYQHARYLGNLWGIWLSKSKDIDFQQLCKQIHYLAKNQEIKPVSKDQERICNRVFWDLIPKMSPFTSPPTPEGAFDKTQSAMGECCPH